MLKLGDRVYVKAKYFRTTRPSRKLADKNLGPYEIIGTHGNYSFTLRLPSQFHTVHPVFHVSQLETAEPDPFPLRQQAPPPPVEIEGEIKYEVSEILDTKFDCRFR